MQSAARPAPSKLRSACNACHAAKVRCSGEKTGCRRCIANGLTCHYAVSMVGRAPSRNKRIRLQSASPAAATSASQSSSPTLDPPTFNGAASTDARHRSGLPLGGHAAETHAEDCNCDHVLSTFRAPTEHDPDFLDLAQMGPDVDVDLFSADLDLRDFPEFAALDSPAAAAPAPDVSASEPTQCPISAISAISPPPERKECQNPNHGKFLHVLHLVKVVGVLESKVAEDVLPLDEALQLNKAALKTITMIFEAENRQPCKTCRALLPTAMDLVLSLYEKVLACQENGPTPADSQSPTFSLGCYRLEPDDQAEFKALLIARELRRTIDTIDSLSLWTRCAKQGANCGTVRWYSIMEERLRKLMPCETPM